MMKRIILLFVLAITFNSVKAQDLPLIDFGVKAGANLSWIRNLPDEFSPQQDAQLGFAAGVFGRINIPLVGLYVQPELLVSQLKSEFSLGFTGSTSTATLGTTYTTLDIPILIGKRFGFGPLGVRVNAGPVFSPVLDANTTGSLTTANGTTDFGETDVTDVVTSMNTSIQVGIGVDISKFNFDVRYQHVFTNLTEDVVLPIINLVQNQVQVEAFSQNFSAFQFTVAYKIL